MKPTEQKVNTDKRHSALAAEPNNAALESLNQKLSMIQK